jgi:hypothetical protein
MTKQPKISCILEKVKIAKISAVKRIQSDPYIALGFTLNRLELILGGL